MFCKVHVPTVRADRARVRVLHTARGGIFVCRRVPSGAADALIASLALYRQCAMSALVPLLLLLTRLQLAAAAAPTPLCHTTTAAPPAALPRGVVSVSSFGADPSGASDSTVALQRALVAARPQNVTLFVPLGCYKVTDTLRATEPRNGRWQPTVIVGQRRVRGALAVDCSPIEYLMPAS